MATVLSDYFKSSERTVFWDDDLKRNVDPFEQLQGGFFAADWDFKVLSTLRISRVYWLIPNIVAHNFETVDRTSTHS